MRLILALTLSGAGIAFGLVYDLVGHRGRGGASASPATSSSPEDPGPPPSSHRHGGAPRPRLRTRDAGVRLATTGWHASAQLVGGMDGCRHGWILVVTSADQLGTSLVSVVSDIKEALALLDAGLLVAVAVDIPIGLPRSRPRTCDVEARRVLGPRRNSVFPAPPRLAVGSATYEEACAASRTARGKAMSKQTFAILPKIQAVDRLMTPDRQDKLVEVHPEVSFTLLAGRPMAHHKATAEGREERLTALRSAFPDIDAHASTWLPGSRPDDLLDAFVAAWSARRFHLGSCQRFGGELDERGLRMEIIA